MQSVKLLAMAAQYAVQRSLVLGMTRTSVCCSSQVECLKSDSTMLNRIASDDVLVLLHLFIQVPGLLLRAEKDERMRLFCRIANKAYKGVTQQKPNSSTSAKYIKN